MRIRWSDAAVGDLDDLTQFIRLRDPKAAVKVRMRIVAATQYLTEFPEIGRGTLRPKYRLYVVKGLPYLIGYRVESDFIEVAAVIDGRMNRSPDLW